MRWETIHLSIHLSIRLTIRLTIRSMILIGGLAAGACGTQPEASWKHFGDAFTVDRSVEASVVLADPSAHAAHPVRVLGELTEVCQSMGCWAVVRDDIGHSIRVTMKDHAFGIDKDSRGHDCDVEGRLVRRAVDPERLAHYASEGAVDHPEAGKAQAWELVATSVATRVSAP